MPLRKTTLKQLSDKDFKTYTAILNMVQNGETSTACNGYLKSRGYQPFAASTYTNIRTKVTEAQETGRPILELLDGRSNKSIRKLDEQGKVTGYTGTEEPMIGADDMSITKNDAIWSTEELEDEMITELRKRIKQRIDTPEDVKQYQNFLKLKEQYHGSQNEGLSIQAIKSYAIMLNSTTNSILQAAMGYIPQEMQEDFANDARTILKDLLGNLEVTPDGRKISQMIKDESVDV